MKRFWLFIGADYYPGGGMNDFISSFDTLDEATKASVNSDSGLTYDCSNDWCHVFDTETKQIFYRDRRDKNGNWRHQPLDKN